MAFSRYERTAFLGFGAQYASSITHTVVQKAVKNGTLSVQTITLHEHERLDHLAGKYYGNSRYWWIIAAASDIGWGLQVPPGTVINIPDLNEVARLVG